MIRRDLPIADNAERWLLITQVEHARVSAELATAWGGAGVPALVCAPGADNPHLQDVRNEVIAGVLHHDDGWASWEASPAIDIDAGQPYSFMELPRWDSLPLWRDSILRGRQLGPLAGWMVAGHFVQLLTDSDDAHCELSEIWLNEVKQWREVWLDEWRSLNRPVHHPELAGECLEWLRVFDWLSLWLCCYCPARPDDTSCQPLTVGDGMLSETPITLTPVDGQAIDEPRRVQVGPWPFVAETFEIDVLGFAVPAARYTAAGELAKSRTPVRLRWQFVP